MQPLREIFAEIIAIGRRLSGKQSGFPGPAVSIVTVTYDGFFYIQLLVATVREFVGQRDYEIIVVDRGSKAPMLKWLHAQPDIRVIPFLQQPGAEHGHGESAELGVRAARHERIVLLDSDAFPVEAHWLACTADRLDDTHRLAGARVDNNHTGNPRGWYIHPFFMTFFKADLDTNIVFRKVRGTTTDSGEEATIRTLDAGFSIIEHKHQFYSKLNVGQPHVPTIAGGVVHAWYTSRLEHNEADVIEDSEGVISRASYSIPLEAKIRRLRRRLFL